MKILVIDPKCPYPYDLDSITKGALGGTESTIIRIAEQLAKKHKVVVAQHNRDADISYEDSLYFTTVNKSKKYIASPDIMIFIQKPQNIRELTIKYPRARKFLWLHNYLEDEVPLFTQDLLIFNIEIICVSETHKKHTEEKIRKNKLYDFYFTYIHKLKIHYLYNPIRDELALDSTPVDHGKLVFFSSPYKGIENVLRLFSIISQNDDLKDLKLYIANPGYIRNFDSDSLKLNNLINLGSLPQKEVLEHVRSAFCVFYPQISRPETFGLVYAEANAVGTPVLAHDFGSAREILTNQEQIIDCTDDNKVIETLKTWLQAQNRPVVSQNPAFRLSNVITSWEKLIGQN